MKTKKRPRVLSWLLFAVVLALLISTTTLSRYMTTVAGTGTGTVAAVVLEGNIDDPTIKLSGLAPGDTKTITFQVMNFKDAKISDVTQDYTITIKSTGNLPLNYTLSGAAAGGGTAIYNGTATKIAPNAAIPGGVLPHTAKATHTYTLTVTWPGGNHDPKYADEVDAIRLIVDARQTD